MASQNITSVETDCINILPTCTVSPLNPFPVGVNVTMEYGQYLDVSPSALTSFYSDSFLGEMAACTLTGECRQDMPEALQVRLNFCSSPAFVPVLFTGQLCKLFQRPYGQLSHQLGALSPGVAQLADCPQVACTICYCTGISEATNPAVDNHNPLRLLQSVHGKDPVRRVLHV